MAVEVVTSPALAPAAASLGGGGRADTDPPAGALAVTLAVV